MKKLFISGVLLLNICSGFLGFSQSKNIYQNIPRLEEVSGVWMNADTAAIEPSVRNFRAQALCNRDITSLSWFASAPYSGGYHTGVMKINGKVPVAQQWRWYPWQALRKAASPNYAISSAIRMLPDNDLVMWKVKISNPTGKVQKITVSQDLIGFISRYEKEQWPWSYPYPTTKGKINPRTNEIVNVRNNIGRGPDDYTHTVADISDPTGIYTEVGSWPLDSTILNSDKYQIEFSDARQLVMRDSETGSYSSFYVVDAPNELVAKKSGGTATWEVTLKPHEEKTIRFMMTYASSASAIQSNWSKWKNNFESLYASVEQTWKSRWAEIFKPNNSILSGCFPVLETQDKEVRKVYYTGPLTMLYLMHNNLPAHKRVFLTGGPRWGATVTFFWDIAEWSTLWAVVDPAMMKEQLKSWIHIDPTKYFGQDNYTGQGVGNGYVANYWALFQHIRSYITVSGDYAFLYEVIDGKKLIDHLTEYAYHWKQLSIYGQKGASDDAYKLADFGDDPWNLLECVPTYIHIVPSFNAGYVWMMREVAKFHQLQGNTQTSKTLNEDADQMAKRVMELYAGNGVWNSLYPDQKKVEVRHILDFMFLGKYMHNDMPDSIKKGMLDFAFRELLTDHWMRAQSLDDVAAKNSDRPDHGPLGAFDAWPPGMMEALTELGYVDSALRIYHQVEPVTYEGCWAQAHELWGDDKYNKHAKVRIPERGWNNRESSAGIEFSQVLLKNFLGFYPQIGGENFVDRSKQLPLNCNLYNVYYDGKYHTIKMNKGTLSHDAVK